MATLKLTKRTVEAAVAGTDDYELRDTEAPGFLCKVTPGGRKVFMLQYRTLGGERRKPSIGLFGELTVDQARTIAQKWLAVVREGGDPSLDKAKARENPSMRALCDEFITRHSIPHNKPSTVKTNQSYIKVHIKPRLGKLKAEAVTRTDIAELMRDMAHIPGAANKVLACLKKMFNCAELWGYRKDGTNPCRLVPKYPEGKRTRLIKNPELAKLYAYLDRADAEGLEHPLYTLAIRLQFAFAARMSEIINLEWEWIEFDERRVIWPDSKTGGISKPLSDEAYDLLWNAPRFHGSPYVVPGVTNPQQRMSKHSYWAAWTRILAASGLAHVGTHGIRHRAATDIANSGIPLKVGMTLTAHKTVTMFMRYVHVEDDQVRAAAEVVADRRAGIIRSRGQAPSPWLNRPPDTLPAGGRIVRPPASYSAGGVPLRRAANDH
jgi:integrase